MGRTVVLALAASLLVCSCALQDPRDAAWDPPRGDLFEQIPNELGGANRHCGGQVRDSDRGTRSPRC
jgi:hypothetical protein